MTQTQPYQINPTNWFSSHTFSAKEKDEETGYSYFGARYYDSDLSVWLSVDPMSDKYPSLTPYNYCLNNPLNFVDFFGLSADNPPAGAWVYKNGELPQWRNFVTSPENAEAQGFNYIGQTVDYIDAKGNNWHGDNNGVLSKGISIKGVEIKGNVKNKKIKKDFMKIPNPIILSDNRKVNITYNYSKRADALIRIRTFEVLKSALEENPDIFHIDISATTNGSHKDPRHKEGLAMDIDGFNNIYVRFQPKSKLIVRFQKSLEKNKYHMYNLGPNYNYDPGHFHHVHFSINRY